MSWLDLLLSQNVDNVSVDDFKEGLKRLKIDYPNVEKGLECLATFLKENNSFTPTEDLLIKIIEKDILLLEHCSQLEKFHLLKSLAKKREYFYPLFKWIIEYYCSTYNDGIKIFAISAACWFHSQLQIPFNYTNNCDEIVKLASPGNIPNIDCLIHFHFSQEQFQQIIEIASIRPISTELSIFVNVSRKIIETKDDAEEKLEDHPSLKETKMILECQKHMEIDQDFGFPVEWIENFEKGEQKQIHFHLMMQQIIQGLLDYPGKKPFQTVISRLLSTNALFDWIYLFTLLKTDKLRLRNDIELVKVTDLNPLGLKLLTLELQERFFDFLNVNDENLFLLLSDLCFHTGQNDWALMFELNHLRLISSWFTDPDISFVSIDYTLKRLMDCLMSKKWFLFATVLSQFIEEPFSFPSIEPFECSKHLKKLCSFIFNPAIIEMNIINQRQHNYLTEELLNVFNRPETIGGLSSAAHLIVVKEKFYGFLDYLLETVHGF